MTISEPARGKWKWSEETKSLVPYVEEFRPISPILKFDEMPPAKHPGDGKIYTSKKAWRRANRDYGYEEVGDQHEWQAKDEPDPAYEAKMEEDLHRSYYEVRDNMAPLDELDKERCKIINKTIMENNYDRREYDEFGKLK